MDYFEISKAILAVAKSRQSEACFQEAVLAAMNALSSCELDEEESKSCRELIADNLKNCSGSFQNQFDSHLEEQDLDEAEEVSDEVQARIEKWIDATEMKDEDFEIDFSWEDFVTAKDTKVNNLNSM